MRYFTASIDQDSMIERDGLAAQPQGRFRKRNTDLQYPPD
jgi:hypothetical protein